MNSWLAFMRRILSIVCFRVVVAMRCFATGASLDSGKYQDYAAMSTERLSALGMHFLSVRQKPDSALVCYTIIANRYRNKEGSKAEMRCYALALNNLGYLFGGHYLDFEHAYGYLQQSIEATKKYHIDDNLAYVYLNMAGIYSNRKELFGISDNDDQIQKYSRMAFDEAVARRQWDVASASFFNLFVSLSDAGSFSKIQADAKRFMGIPALKNDPMARFVFDAYNGTKAFNNGDYRNSIVWFERQLRAADAVKTVKESCKELALWNIYTVYHKMGKWREAKEILERLDGYAAKYGEAATHSKVLQQLAQLYRAQGKVSLAEHYDYLFLKAKDSLLTRSNAERMERSAFIHELSIVNGQLLESNARHHQMVMTVVVLSAFIIIIAVALVVNIRGMRKQKAYVRKLYEKNVELLSHGSPAPPASKSADSRAVGLNENQKNSLSERIYQTINDPGVFCSQDFSLHQLAVLVGSNDKYVSQVINQRYNKNFKQLLNDVRVAEACRRLKDQDSYGNLTIAAIAADVGFGSRSNFALAFKRVTGISPSDFLRQAHENNQG